MKNPNSHMVSIVFSYSVAIFSLCVSQNLFSKPTDTIKSSEVRNSELSTTYIKPEDSSDIRSQIQNTVIKYFQIRIANWEDSDQVRYEIYPGYINPAIKISSCSRKLEVITSHQNQRLLLGRHTVKIVCSNPAWTFHLPVRIGRYEKIPFSAKPIRRGTVLTHAHILLKEVETSNPRFRHAITDLNRILDKTAKRSLPRLSIFKENHLKVTEVINRGDEVLIQAAQRGLRVKMKGVALESGQIKEQIKVKNMSSNKIISATIIDVGVVQVRF